MKLSAKAYRWLDIAIRLVVGGVFIYAGTLKIGEPLQFGDKVASFEMLPNAFVNSLALGLPVFEILTGLLLIVAWLRRPAALGLMLINGIFLIAIVTALARGLTIRLRLLRLGHADSRQDVDGLRTRCRVVPGRLIRVSLSERKSA